MNRHIFVYQCCLPLQWRHNDRDGVSNHQSHACLLICSFRRRSEKPSKLRVTGICEGNSPMIGEFPAQTASYAENVAIWWRCHSILPPNHPIQFIVTNLKVQTPEIPWHQPSHELEPIDWTPIMQLLRFFIAKLLGDSFKLYFCLSTCITLIYLDINIYENSIKWSRPN